MTKRDKHSMRVNDAGRAVPAAGKGWNLLAQLPACQRAQGQDVQHTTDDGELAGFLWRG